MALLDAIEAEMDLPEFHLSFDLAEKFLVSYGERDLAFRLAEECPRDRDPRVVGTLLEILSWMVSGEEEERISRTTERWLVENACPWRVMVALSLDRYPFLDASEMYSVLQRVGDRWVEARSRCSDLTVSRRSDEARRSEHPSGIDPRK